jgi:23S rRNA pseudouridine2605 synthase
LNQQQLQIARAALWHQTAAAALATFDDASAWLDDLGLCLFLPRHVQIPAPAPSLVEACLGAASVTPPAAAIAQATELAARLTDERRAIPLNLLGAHSDQPDFLVIPDVLPWVAALRGDRQWKTAPGGRATPLVIRVWQALDQRGEATAVELRELLGRELTEAAVLRALIELWTTLRAIPLAALDQPTRWTLLKNRYPAQLATAANTAQATALSALLSIYLRSAVAATAEEAEVFLSPLTSRSRIREVLHGMMAARQFATMSVGTQTLLFVEGSLPETVAAPEPETRPPSELPAVTAVQPEERRRSWHETRRPASQPQRESRAAPRFAKARPQESSRGQRRPEQDRRESRPGRPGKPGLGKRREGPPQRFGKPGFDKRRGQSRPAPPDRAERPAASSPGRPGPKPWQRRRQPGAPARPPRPWQKRPGDRRQDRRDDKRPRDGRSFTEDRRSVKSGETRPGRPDSRNGPARGPRSGRPDRFSPGKRFSREDRPPRDDRRPSFNRSATKQRTGGPTSGRNFGRKPDFSRARPGKTAKRPFRPSNSFPGKRNPRKNRSEEETPE